MMDAAATTETDVSAPVATDADAGAPVDAGLDQQRKDAAADRSRRHREKKRTELAGTVTKVSIENNAAVTAAVTERNEKMLRAALSESVELLADATHYLALDRDAPMFGPERARRIGDLWARVLAPHLDADVMKWLPGVIAGTATAAAVAGWMKEIAEHKKARTTRTPPRIVTEAASATAT